MSSHCSKTVVVPCSKRGRTDHDGANRSPCKRLKNQVESRIFLTVQNPRWNSKSAGTYYSDLVFESLSAGTMAVLVTIMAAMAAFALTVMRL